MPPSRRQILLSDEVALRQNLGFLPAVRSTPMSEPRNLARVYFDLFVDAWMARAEAWPFACGEGWREILTLVRSPAPALGPGAGGPPREASARMSASKELCGLGRPRPRPWVDLHPSSEGEKWGLG